MCDGNTVFYVLSQSVIDHQRAQAQRVLENNVWVKLYRRR